MEVDHDLRKFIVETAVAQRQGMLSSGCEASGTRRALGAAKQGKTVLTAGGRRPGRA